MTDKAFKSAVRTVFPEINSTAQQGIGKTK
jgi:hypothetical protein